MTWRFCRSLLLCLFLLPWVTVAADTEGTSYSSKLCLRTNNGVLKNSGSQGGSSISVGGIDLSFLYPVGAGFFVGAGYQAHFDFKNKTVPFSSLDVVGRFYLLGQGTSSRTNYASMTSERNDAFNLYLSAEFGRRDYYIGSATPASSTSMNTTGNSLGLNAALGADFRLSTRIQLTMEGNAAVVDFASSDSRYIISGLLFKLGVAYLW